MRLSPRTSISSDTAPRYIGIAGCCLLLGAVVGGGCSNSLKPNIHSADAGERILAIRAAGEARDQHAVPLLVDRLEDEDEAVRFYAILALDKITGQRLGYDYRKSIAERVQAVERWRQYLRSGRQVGLGGSQGSDGKDHSKGIEASGVREPAP